jgi:hypothetical protein
MRWMVLALVFAGCAAEDESFRVMTFNIGTTTGMGHDTDDNGYSEEMAQIADELYENSLSWNPAERDLIAWLAEHRPTIVVFQEGFYDRWCEEIEVDPELDFVCKGYTPERPLQIERLLGPDYQVACADGQEDNCAGVLRSFATMRGCPLEAPCLGGLEGMGPPDGCSRGARVGRVVLDLHDGTELTLVNVHGTSGVTDEDMECRSSQFAQIFIDRGDGEPAASGERNLVMGDLNTDPWVLETSDPSAQLWNEYVGPGKPYEYISGTPETGPPTYAGLFRIDHVVSDALTGGCVVPGTREEPPVHDGIYWDHMPQLCDVTWR